jgi:hypothetical protein
MEQRPEQPPEGKLIGDAAARLELSIREAARRAGLSYGRWRQICQGYQNVSPGSFAPVHAPAKTVAKMAKVVGVTPAQLAKAGREDAAEALAGLQQPVAAAPEPPGETPDPGESTVGQVSTAVIRAAVPATVRQIWTRVRHDLAATPAGCTLFADPAQARAWPAGSAPLEVTEEAAAVLDAMRNTLFTDPVENLASRLVAYTWPERIMVAAASLDVLGQRPTKAVRRAG